MKHLILLVFHLALVFGGGVWYGPWKKAGIGKDDAELGVQERARPGASNRKLKDNSGPGYSAGQADEPIALGAHECDSHSECKEGDYCHTECHEKRCIGKCGKKPVVAAGDPNGHIANPKPFEPLEGFDGKCWGGENCPEKTFCDRRYPARCLKAEPCWNCVRIKPEGGNPCWTNWDCSETQFCPVTLPSYSCSSVHLCPSNCRDRPKAEARH
ncbi:unnamed protein product, partial [Mesorhabditis spiculigera]